MSNLETRFSAKDKTSGTITKEKDDSQSCVEASQNIVVRTN